MPHRWIQIKGDPSVRAFLFQQQRVESVFDRHLDRVHGVIAELARSRGLFHVKVHYSSSQLSCWFVDFPYAYRVYVADEVLSPGFVAQFPEQGFGALQPVLATEQVQTVLDEFKRLRLTDAQVYLRHGSLNRFNGMIGMTFSCDGTHYIDWDTFLQKLETFGKAP